MELNRQWSMCTQKAQPIMGLNVAKIHRRTIRIDKETILKKVGIPLAPKPVTRVKGEQELGVHIYHLYFPFCFSESVGSLKNGSGRRIRRLYLYPSGN